MKKILLLISSLIILTNCSKEPEAITYNKDECAHCMMQITDPKFGSELITEKGKIYKFDSIECLADYVLADRGFQVESLWISDYSKPNTLVDAKTAYYIVSSKMESPMSMNLGGFEQKSEMEKVLAVMGGKQLNWSDVLNYVKNSK